MSLPKLRILNQHGFDHIFLVVGFVVMFGIVGTAMLVAGHAAPTSQWKGILEVSTQNSGYCVTAIGSSTGSPIELEPCSKNYDAEQVWSLNDIETATIDSESSIQEFDLQSADGTNECLDNVGSAQSASYPAKLNTCSTTSTAMTWFWNTKFTSQGYSTHQLRNISALSLCLDDKGGSDTAGTYIGLYACKKTGQTNQEWFEAGAPSEGSSSSGQSRPPGIYVSGNRLVDSKGNTIVLHGVDRSGTEYECDEDQGIFDGPSDQSSINAMLSWHVNAVRLPMNSACWLDTQAQLSTPNSAYVGANYRNAIVTFVNLLNKNGIYVILDLHWTGCGTNTTSCKAGGQEAMPDRPYATQFWSSVASTFKNNHGVIFDLYNEPYASTWSCWENGGCTGNAGTANTYTEEGMQEMVTAVRQAGATTQPIMLGGLGYSSDVSQWLSHEPTDPDKSIVLSVHSYTYGTPCNSPTTAPQAETCYSSGSQNLAPIAATTPVVFGEIGETDCTSTFIDSLMPWLDSRHYSYLGWAWDTNGCENFPSLISNYNGTATGFGTGFQQHLTTTFPVTGSFQ